MSYFCYFRYIIPRLFLVSALSHMLFFVGLFSCVDFWRHVLSYWFSCFCHFFVSYSSLVSGVFEILDLSNPRHSYATIKATSMYLDRDIIFLASSRLQTMHFFIFYTHVDLKYLESWVFFTIFHSLFLGIFV
jgi:hypothetical protein